MRRRAHGEGSIYQLPDGSWRASLDLGWHDGKRKRKYIRGATQAEVRQKLAEASRAHADGLMPAPERLTVGRFLDEWLDTAVRPSLAPKTVRSYEGVVRVHLMPQLGKVRLRVLQVSDIQRLLNALRSDGKSARTVQQVREVLRNALNSAVRAGYLHRNPAELVVVATPERRHVQPFSDAQSLAFVEAATDERLGPLFLVALGAGLRQGEALGLRWEDIDFEGSSVSVEGSLKRVDGSLRRLAPKTRASRRRVPAPQYLMRALRRQRTQQIEERLLAGSLWQETGYVFTAGVGTPMDGPAVTKQLHRFLAEAGLPDMTFHDLRHQYGSILVAKGVSIRVVAELLGHQDPALTLRTYSHVLPETKRDAIDRLDAIFEAV